MAGWLAGWIAKSMSLSFLHTSSRARRVRGGGGSSSGRVGQDGEARQVNLTAGRQAGEQTDTRDRFLAVHSSQVLGKVRFSSSSVGLSGGRPSLGTALHDNNGADLVWVWGFDLCSARVAFKQLSLCLRHARPL